VGLKAGHLASRSWYWDRGGQLPGRKDILVVDEAGMLGSRQMARILEVADQGNAKVVLVGDTQQLQAIEAGAALRAIIERTGRFGVN
jgi:ATP-dependent exoDNAse (exonuclease V) alpha subunit